ncbi:tRNA delta(2)-isopentenylpyrophosphate transferase, putative [Eimeria mitis]|uniref:tRNA delta(2)-isopentenylpyrophosphate transferase, putative n=1 Tax=Eimeria mitis TaxID=44415 RepID=U6JWQ9_9EIME|nr:tRNA delta(2)-isopentenylpyrophosphate transferase, putative [Eimeria mitis]CDJ28492.1 tRNA delta(2)-isopentenylpyrophosphate transferase, putative [Eimeria mitis]
MQVLLDLIETCAFYQTLPGAPGGGPPGGPQGPGGPQDNNPQGAPCSLQDIEEVQDLCAALANVAGRYDACIFWLDLRDREALEKRLRQRLETMCKVRRQKGDRERKETEIERRQRKETEIERRQRRETEIEGRQREKGDRERKETEKEKRLRQRLETMCKDGLLDEVRWVAAQLQLRSWQPPASGGPTRSPQGPPGGPPMKESEVGAPLKEYEVGAPLKGSAAVAEWKEKIYGPALQIVKDFLGGEKFSEESEFAAAKQMPDCREKMNSNCDRQG